MKTLTQKNLLYFFMLLGFCLALGFYFNNEKDSLKPLEENASSTEQAELITIYSKRTCIYCIKAKNYLKDRALEFKEIDLNESEEAHNELKKLMKRVTVPQVFIGEHLVGGYSDLIKLTDEELRTLLYP